MTDVLQESAWDLAHHNLSHLIQVWGVVVECGCGSDETSIWGRFAWPFTYNRVEISSFQSVVYKATLYCTQAEFTKAWSVTYLRFGCDLRMQWRVHFAWRRYIHRLQMSGQWLLLPGFRYVREYRVQNGFARMHEGVLRAGTEAEARIGSFRERRIFLRGIFIDVLMSYCEDLPRKHALSHTGMEEMMPWYWFELCWFIE